MKTYRKILIALLMVICAISCAFAVACTPKEALAAPQNVNIITNLKEDETTEWLLSWDAVDGASSYEVYVNGNYKATAEDNEFKLNGLVGTSSYDIGVVALPDEKSFTKSEATTITYTFEKVTKGLTYTLLEDGTYSVSAESATIAQITGRVVFPDTYKNKNISSLAERCFQKVKIVDGAAEPNNSYTTEIRWPKYITKISDFAFYTCLSLKNVSIPESVIYLGRGAFQSCESLTEMTVPNTITEVSSSLFSGCNSLTSVILPKNATKIGNAAFVYCIALKEIIIPNAVQEIGSSAFGGCSALTQIIIPKSVTTIGARAFSGCTSIKNITIPETVVEIGDGLFSECTDLEQVTLPIALTKIYDSMFRGCSAIKEFIITSNVTIISGQAFLNCSSLRQITIPNTVTNIYLSAFSGCSSLATINFNGTMAEWLAIEKGEYWCDNTGDFTVICTDGKLDKEGNVVE